ncbi:serine hydrolase domain-containing protein [uncultured Paraglaciecola sp.]|uniref:serine hydrolase domain-containing protein n=1 Tax=uncultured Paraglaciecola sp. TaxID=1765024 RepID=UPI0030D98422|tara:strand:+ start:5025 stop:7022 length:1998 start_codon:yes stop_codon:yes gene_type:complete
MKLPQLVCLAAVILISACSLNKSENESEPAPVVEITLNTTPTFDAPKGWSVSNKNETVMYTAPEGDTTLTLVPIANALDAQHAAKMAWKTIDANFARKVKLSTQEPPARGWDAIWEIEYQTSPSEERRVSAYPHHYAGKWTVLLIDGHLGTMSKRSAAARTLYRSITRAGYQAEDLSGRTANTLTPEILHELLAFVESAAENLDIPGAGIGIMQNGTLIYTGGVGVKDIETGEPIDGNTRFIIASNTKGMTTLLLAKLVEMGRIRWDDPVINHYPNFRLGDDKTTQSVLVRHLVCACTGLPRKDFEWVFNNTASTPAIAVFDELAGTQPTSSFGEIYQYNNQMAAAAGYVAAHLLYPNMEIGAAYDRAMQEYIFAPLSMSNTTFDFKAALNGNIAKPYTVNFDGEIEDIKQTPSDGFNHTMTAYRPAGGAWSTPTDMLKYIQNELTAGISPNGTRLFAEAPLLERRAPFVETGAGSSYGMGLSNKDINGIAIVKHGGSMAGYLSQMFIIPESNVGAVILTNSDQGWALFEPFERKLIELLYNGESKAAAQVTATKQSIEQARAKERALLTIPADPDVVSALAKTYHSPKLGTVDIRVMDDAVVLDSGAWSSPLGSKINPDGTVSLVATGDATLGQLELLIGETNGKRTLSVITPQHKYVLTEPDS